MSERLYAPVARRISDGRQSAESAIRPWTISALTCAESLTTKWMTHCTAAVCTACIYPLRYLLTKTTFLLRSLKPRLIAGCLNPLLTLYENHRLPHPSQAQQPRPVE